MFQNSVDFIKAKWFALSQYGKTLFCVGLATGFVAGVFVG